MKIVIGSILLSLSFLVHGFILFAKPGHPSPSKLLSLAETAYKASPQKTIAIVKRYRDSAHASKNYSFEIESLNLLAKFYIWESHFDSAKNSNKYALLLASYTHVDSLLADCWRMSGSIDHHMDNYTGAIAKYETAISYYKGKINPNAGLAYLNAGFCYRRIGQYQQSINKCLGAIKIFAALKNDANLANAYKSIALSFVSQKNYPKAIEYNKKALTLRQGLGDAVSVAQSLNNIGFAYKASQQPDSAISYLGRSIAIYQKQSDSSLLVLPLQNLGSSWKMKGEYAKALRYINRSLKIAGVYGMKEEIGLGNADLAELYAAQKNFGGALVAAKIAEQMATELKLPEMLMQTYFDEFDIYAQKGDYRSAVIFVNRGNRIKDSLLSVEKARIVNELDIKYQTAQRLKDIASLNTQTGLQRKIVGQQKTLITVLIVAASLLLVLLSVAYNNFRKKKAANQRIELLMRELHHRVKNNLTVLSGLFLMQIDSSKDEHIKNTLRENRSRLESMNLIHRRLYQQDVTTTIEMREYLSKLLQHIQESFGDNNRIELKTNIDVLEIDADKAIPIGLIVNELATNSFKYAFPGGTGEISVMLKKNGKSKLRLTLGDNGKGMPVTKKEYESFGLKLVALMARQLHAAFSVDNDNGLKYVMDFDV